MANLISSHKTATTEVFRYDDGSQAEVNRLAYTVGGVAHTDDCPVALRIPAGTGPKGGEEVELIDILPRLEDGSLTECEQCATLRAAANYPESAEPAPDTPKTEEEKESTTMPTKTASKIELPASFKSTPSVTAVVDAIERGHLGTTAEIAQAAGVTAPSAKSALLALESAGILVHADTGTGRNKVTTWDMKGAKAPAKKTAAEYKKAMEAKPPKAPAGKAKAATAPPKKAEGAAASSRVPTGERAKKATEWLKKNPGTPFSVLKIEEGCDYPVKTLAGVLARMAENPETGIQRADTPEGRRGFKYVPPKGAKN